MTRISGMSRILSVWLPTLPTDRLKRERAPSVEPLATVMSVKGAQRIAAVDAAAAAASIRPGMALADARAACPHLAVVPADPTDEAATLQAILDWSLRFTPIAALDPPDGLLLDITGAAHLFGGEGALLTELTGRLARHGFASRAAVAETIEAAWALARHGGAPVAAPGSAGLAELCRPLPLAALRLDEATLQSLTQAGLRQIGDVLDRPRAPLAARFGADLFVRLDGLLARHKSPLVPSRPIPVFLSERRWPSAIATADAIRAAVRGLATSLCTQLDQHGMGARHVEAAFFRVDGVVKRITVGTSRPLRAPAALARLFDEKLDGLGEDGLDTGYGFDVIRLGAGVVERLAEAQADLSPSSPDATAETDLALLVDRLGARLGTTRVVRLRNADRHEPEAAAVALSAQQAAETASAGADDPDLCRPLRLFDRPEPIRATAEVPGRTADPFPLAPGAAQSRRCRRA